MPHIAFTPQRTRCYAPARPQHSQRSYTNQDFLPFLSLIDSAFNEINKAAARQQQSQQVLKTRFDVRETQEGYEIEGEIPGVEQEDISIEFSDDQTLTIKGKTERSEAGNQTQTPAQAEEPQAIEQQPESDNHSETSSVRSHQATVEDDFEDLAAESDTVSSASQPQPSAADKGKQPATEEVAPPAYEAAQSTQEEQQESTSRNWVSERSFGSFSRTFKFPVRVNTDAVKASLKNGVLAITIPKAPVAEVRRIFVE